MTKNKKRQGFTLIEVLVFVSILALFFVSAAAITIASLRNMQINQHKILATHYGEEALESIRGEKEKNWTDFISKGDSNGIKYCLNNLSSWGSGSCTDYFGSPSIFQREAELTTNIDSTQVKVKITVKWQELGRTFTVPITTILSIWE